MTSSHEIATLARDLDVAVRRDELNWRAAAIELFKRLNMRTSLYAAGHRRSRVSDEQLVKAVLDAQRRGHALVDPGQYAHSAFLEAGKTLGIAGGTVKRRFYSRFAIQTKGNEHDRHK